MKEYKFLIGNRNQLNREAKAAERRWRIGLKKKEDEKQNEEWELEKIGIFCVVFRSKIFRGSQP